jgi:hypothetical protein
VGSVEADLMPAPVADTTGADAATDAPPAAGAAADGSTSACGTGIPCVERRRRVLRVNRASVAMVGRWYS